jgi:enamine deaminase RidA (YjgF/YER057c/UK114 family)
MAKFHNPKTIADPIGSYSNGVEVPPNARWLHVAGQVALRRDGSVPSTIEEQTEVCWRNVLAILESAGMKVTDVVKMTQYLTRLDNFPAYAATRAKFLGGHRPASTGLIISSLIRPEFLVEVEAVAAKAAAAPKAAKAAKRPAKKAAKRKKR